MQTSCNEARWAATAVSGDGGAASAGCLGNTNGDPNYYTIVTWNYRYFTVHKFYNAQTGVFRDTVSW